MSAYSKTNLLALIEETMGLMDFLYDEPGVAKLYEEGECAVRSARDNLKKLEAFARTIL